MSSEVSGVLSTTLEKPKDRLIRTWQGRGHGGARKALGPPRDQTKFDFPKFFKGKPGRAEIDKTKAGFEFCVKFCIY